MRRIVSLLMAALIVLGIGCNKTETPKENMPVKGTSISGKEKKKGGAVEAALEEPPKK